MGARRKPRQHGATLAPHPRGGGQLLSPIYIFVLIQIFTRAKPSKQAFSGRTSQMPVELLVILGAEASILGFVVAMSLHTKRTDVLSGRSFEHPVVPPGANRRPARWRDQEARDTRWWPASSRSFRQISFGTPITRVLRRILPIWPLTRVRSEARARATGTPAPGACDGAALLSEAGRDTDAQGKGAGPEHMQSRAAAILHQLSAP